MPDTTTAIFNSAFPPPFANPTISDNAVEFHSEVLGPSGYEGDPRLRMTGFYNEVNDQRTTIEVTPKRKASIRQRATGKVPPRAPPDGPPQ